MLMRFSKTLVYAALGNSVAAALKARLIAQRRAVTVLNLHRVAPPDGSVYAPLAPELFDSLLTFCKQHFEVLPLKGLPQAAWKKPPLVLSFDDGYKDFIDYAVPLLRKHGLPANQNVIPASIESGRPPINVMAQDFIGQASWPAIEALRLSGWKLQPHWGRARETIGRQLASHLKNRTHEQRQALEDELLPQMMACDEFRPATMMRRDDVRSLVGEFEIGVHSFDHDSMGFESDAHVAADAARCRTYLRDVLDVDAGIYAFPNGSFRPEHIGIVRAAGFHTFLLVDEEFARPESDMVERFTFYATTERQARFRATGGLQMPN